MPDLTPQALYDLAQRVPVEARPSGMHYGSAIPHDHAILMHEAAAMRWLEEHAKVGVLSAKLSDGTYQVVIARAGLPVATAPTRYEALVAAIEGLEPKRGNCYIKYGSGTGPRG